MSNLRQINLGVRMYCDESNDKAPDRRVRVSRPYTAYKELMKHYVGLRGTSSARDKLFACPADVFYYDYVIGHHPGPAVGYVSGSLCTQPSTDYSSYGFNGGNQFGRTNVVRPGIAGLSLSSVKHPARTVLRRGPDAHYRNGRRVIQERRSRDIHLLSTRIHRNACLPWGESE